MGIKVVYQGILSEKTGCATESFSETGPSGNVILAIIQKHPSLKKLHYVIAVNGVISHGNQEIKEDDIVTLIPPAPGG